MIALQGCRIERVVDGHVEIVVADAQDRTFPECVMESLGICAKSGPAHDVKADGRHFRCPRDAICVRAPGCVWSAAATGPVAFVSIEIGQQLLPSEGLGGGVSFAQRADVPDLRSVVNTLRSNASGLWKEWLVAHLVEALIARGLVRAPAFDAARVPHTAERAREILEHALGEAPSLTELAAAIGVNRFALLRAFRRRFGLPPHAFLIRLRAERARARLARGVDLVEVAHELGFADQSHMTRVFKRVYGITPAAYCRAVRR